MSLKTKLDRMAVELVDAGMPRRAGEAVEMPTKERVEIFKAVTNWYLGVNKRNKDPDDAPAGETFEALKSRINGGESVQ